MLGCTALAFSAGESTNTYQSHLAVLLVSKIFGSPTLRAWPTQVIGPVAHISIEQSFGLLRARWFASAQPRRVKTAGCRAHRTPNFATSNSVTDLRLPPNTNTMLILI
ncbi:hypothetical protein BOTBODRAFT_321259 [Botryobasidium botryosum FD-172 SS1]|uniref:Uncharacterized protein n=1 Tax=Botryobasidium botryosum (strain FD-172 SS1) TaxID=930990 RepID=A0A067MYS2_BOTB1|nr:hypothetical protein BOTBODRAFT_321259 [Botryobasidium botryosum FD-172 SS1]